MEFPSLLYTEAPAAKIIAEDVFVDLKLDLLLSAEAIEAMRTPCQAADIPVRQALFRELEDTALRAPLQVLAQEAQKMGGLHQAYLSARCDNERNYIFVNLMAAVVRFYQGAAAFAGGSPLARRFRETFRTETQSAHFSELAEQATKLAEQTEALRVNCYRMVGENLYIRREEAPTLVSRLLKSARDLGLRDGREGSDMSLQLNPRLINALAGLEPEAFAAFKRFYEQYLPFFDEKILRYASQLNFYLEVSEIMDRLRAAGVPVCLPEVTPQEKAIHVVGVRDISLLAKNETNIIPNDIEFDASAPFFFLTGANGGGKTTYLRSVGIAVVLFLSGCPIAAERARIYPVDCVYTHFPRDERFDGEGRFADEENRVAEILAAHGGNSLVLLNETYSTTSEELALELTAKLADTLYDSGSFGIYITHQHGIGQTRIPFLSVIIDESDANRRTYKIARQRGASGSFAMDILKKYGLTQQALEERFPAAEKGGAER